MDLFLLKKLLTALVLPPTGPLLLAIAGAVLWRRRPRLGGVMVWTGLATLLALSMSPVSSFLLRLAGHGSPLQLEDAKTAQAIVILGGGVRRDALEYGGDTLGRLSLDRVRYGARIARATGLPVLVSGGAPWGGATEASVMRGALEQEFGVPVRWAEDRSRNTHENARFSAEMLNRDGVKRVVLVMHGFDMRRASAEFAAAGLEVVPAPTVVPNEFSVTSPFDFLPGMSSLQASYYALYELLANAVRR
jgi:uncharacterized SAM-binding protein YcdF (DUF218 family)